ncbi:MAG: hypothetical protein ACOXZR_04490 [Bacilli bacterium]|jgi:transcription elongation GreA/GreB family factor
MEAYNYQQRVKKKKDNLKEENDTITINKEFVVVLDFGKEVEEYKFKLVDIPLKDKKGLEDGLSIKSPLGQVVFGKKKGDQFRYPIRDKFNNKIYASGIIKDVLTVKEIKTKTKKNKTLI